MEWTQFIIFFLGVFGLFIWNRSESREDARHMDNKLDANRNLIFEVHKETNAQIVAIREEGDRFREELKDLRIQMNNETKDFHYKLLEIERTRK